MTRGYAYLLLQRVWLPPLPRPRRRSRGVRAGGDPSAPGLALGAERRPLPPSAAPRRFRENSEGGRPKLSTTRASRGRGRVARPLASLSTVASWTGDPRQGRARAREAMETIEVSDVDLPRVYVGIALGIALARLGESEEARQVLENGLAEVAETPQPIVESNLRAQLGFLELSSGASRPPRPSLALRRAPAEDGVPRVCDAPRRRPGRERAAPWRSRAGRGDRGRSGGARRAAPAALDPLRLAALPGLLLAARGDLGAATEALDEALVVHGEARHAAGARTHPPRRRPGGTKSGATGPGSRAPGAGAGPVRDMGAALRQEERRGRASPAAGLGPPSGCDGLIAHRGAVAGPPPPGSPTGQHRRRALS